MKQRHEYKIEKRGLVNLKYAAVCSCGYVGPSRDLASIAEDDGAAHADAEAESGEES